MNALSGCGNKAPRVKICGVTDLKALEACVAAGASYIGLVSFQKSPRHLGQARAAEIARAVPPGIAKVSLTVNATDDELAALLDNVPIDILQLHGAETAERVGEVKTRFGLPVMKAIGIQGPSDLAMIDHYGPVADMLLVDAKPPKTGELPGGNGLSFDWRLIANRKWPVPWMLAGGLTAENVAEAIRLTGATQVDVSSGVERARGIKDPDRIAAFCRAAGTIGAL